MTVGAEALMCHFYEVSHGYSFSTIGEEKMEVILVQEQLGGEKDELYKAMVVEEGKLYWNWSELVDLIKDYAGDQCGAVQPPSGSELLPVDISTFWKELVVPWDLWFVMS